MASLQTVFVMACAAIAAPLLATAAPQHMHLANAGAASSIEVADMGLEDVEATGRLLRHARNLAQRSRRPKSRRSSTDNQGTFFEEPSTELETETETEQESEVVLALSTDDSDANSDSEDSDGDVSASDDGSTEPNTSPATTSTVLEDDSEEPAEAPLDDGTTVEDASSEPEVSEAAPASTVGGVHEGHGTHFTAMGTPFGGCGVPPANAVDDNGKALPFVALNTNTWEADDETGKTVYGYTMDSCADNNFWCQNDDGHLDMSEPYLDTMGYTGTLWNGRKVTWSYMSNTPSGWSMQEPKFMFMFGSSAHWASLIVYNIPDGFNKLEQQDDDGTWSTIPQNQPLGNQFHINPPSGSTVTVRITGASGTNYGTFEVDFPCSNGCASNTDVSAQKVG